ncbi:MAG: DUF3881 family protein [Lachnospiraceae bacterium]|nr:DUF3881 family protein [Lachnospiraceae bacterium]
MIHIFFRSIGFHEMTENADVYKVVDDVIRHPDEQYVDQDSFGNDFACFSKYVGSDMGISACGSFTRDDRFRVEYYFPFFRGTHVSTREPVDIERQAGNESFYGICDELKMGIPLIFYISNVGDVFRDSRCGGQQVAEGNTVLSGLAHHGKILFPIMHNEETAEIRQKSSEKRMTLMQQARDGDKTAMENLTLSDMDLYASISRRVVKEDVLSIVESSIIPYGVESDQYTVIGEIEDVYVVRNQISNEKVWVLTLLCNDLEFDVCINENDLLGEPEVGRRFKGRIWMQGYVNFKY